MNPSDLIRLMEASSERDRETERALAKHKGRVPLRSVDMPGPNVIDFMPFLDARRNGTLRRVPLGNSFDNGSAA